MPKSELLTIGVFARSSGLTASALRFYADSGLVEPASVDRSSGYRYYAPDQVERAVMVRRLREIDMPLELIAEVLDPGGRDAARIIDDHVAGLAHRADLARETAAAVKARLVPAPQSPPVRLSGPVFTAAVEQVLTATTHEPGLPVLNGVRVEVSAEGVVLAATDRYRLAIRTLVPVRPSGSDWSATLDADDLRPLLSWARRRPELRLSARPGSVLFEGDDAARECRTLAGPFPDHRLVVASLPEVRTRAVVSRNALVRCLERQGGHRVRLEVSDGAVTVPPGEAVPAAVTGPAIGLDFALATLHPAIGTAVGPDVMLDIAGADQPVVVRSADDGDLTTLVMPVRPEPPAQEGPS
ncbi:MerR family transcriptional regulator [Saccharothrix xinjiangensis]|uniref:MerR family transcriptional regulator n=1 Tax=Saccharothrix xinjiangensis TaxID=204798 RepID=A0ABV9YCV5_9PSEU